MADLANNDYWYLVFEGGGTPPDPNPPGTLTRINLLFTPLFTRPYIKLFVNSPSARISWRFGGYFYLYVGGIFSENPIYANRKGCLLNEWTLFYYPMLDSTQSQSASSWHIRYEAPYWFKDVDIQVYQYYDG